MILKKYFIVFLILSFWGCFGQIVRAQISPTLQQRLRQNPDDWQEVYILLRRQTDLSALEKKFALRQSTPEDRAKTVIRNLQITAGESQTALLSWLGDPLNSLIVDQDRITPYWISNLITARLKKSAILSLAQREDIAQLIWVAPVMGDSYGVNGEHFSPKVVGGHEPGHDAIQAPPLWAMGYSGYGRKILIIDSGVDGSHPALGPNFWGNYVPLDQAWYHPNASTYPQACDLHGTHVSGIAVGYDPLTQDTVGVAPAASWMASPAVPANNGTSCNVPIVPVVSALQWALNPDGDTATTSDIPDVINNSWSVNSPTPGNECNSIFKTVFDALEVAGIAAVFSAGNQGPGTSTISSPKNIVTSPVNTFCVGMVFGQSPGFPIVNGSSRGPALCGSLLDNQFKPEVVAPGSNIRSSGLNSQYFALTGTSMAAPHVSGALLLLKEAFPYLSGTQLKYALYNSSLDLGATGEDNTFGMGLINVKAAFDSLVQQGNTPVLVSENNDVALLSVLGLTGFLCDSLIAPRLVVENKGLNPIDSLLIVQEDQNGSPDTLFWTANQAPGSIDTLDFPPTTLSSGTYTYRYEIIEVNGQEDYHYLDNSRTLSFSISAETPTSLYPIAAVCAGNEVLLAAQNNQDQYWYDDPFTDLHIAEGPSFVSPPLNVNTTFYVAPVQVVQTGKSDNVGDPGVYDETAAWLWFSAERSFTLRSVLVYGVSDGIRTVELRDRQDNVIQSIDLSVGFGPRRLQLEFRVPQADSLRLGIINQTGSPQLFTSTNGVAYPYQIPQILDIFGSSLGPNAYPYCYDWEVAYSGCRSEVAVSVVPGQQTAAFSQNPPLVYLANGGNVQFMDQSTNASQWLWLFGDGDSSTQQNPQHTYTSPGVYTVSLQTVNANACSDVVQDSIRVVDWNVGAGPVIEDFNIKLSPNPTKGKVRVDIDQSRAGYLSWQLFDLQGRLRQQGSWYALPQDRQELDLSALAKGLYILRLTDGKAMLSLKLSKE